jgi:hypothetical protein
MVFCDTRCLQRQGQLTPGICRPVMPYLEAPYILRTLTNRSIGSEPRALA